MAQCRLSGHLAALHSTRAIATGKMLIEETLDGDFSNLDGIAVGGTIHEVLDGTSVGINYNRAITLALKR